jgi:putative transposase
MPKPKMELTADFPYHIWTRANNREFFAPDQGAVWKIFCQSAQEVSEKFGVRFLNLVKMSNHYHMIVWTPQANIGEVMRCFNLGASKGIARLTNTMNHQFGSPYDGKVIKNDHYLCNVYKYVYRNPVAAGLCATVESYPYSTLRFALGKESPPFRLVDWTSLPIVIDHRRSPLLVEHADSF